MLTPVLVALLGTSPATPELGWDAPRSCPDSAFVHARLEQLLPGMSPEIGGKVRIDARVTRRSDDEYRLSLTVRDGGGTRTREASARDCELLAEATALIAATFVGPLGVSARVGADAPSAPTAPGRSSGGIVAPSIPEPPAGPLPSEREALDTDPSPTEPRPHPAGSDRAPAPSRRADHAGLRLSAVVGRGVQPDLDVGPSLTGAWSRGPLRLEAALTALVPRTRAHSSLAGVALRQSLYALTIRACRISSGPRWMLAMCGGTEIGAVVATGQGVTRPRTAASPWGAFVLGFQAAWRLSPRWSLWVGPEGLVAYAVSAFTVGDSTAQPVGRGGIRAHLGVELRFR